MVMGREFKSSCAFTLYGKQDGDEAGFGIVGRQSAYICVVYEGGEYLFRYCLSGEEGEKILMQMPLPDGAVKVEINGVNRDIYRIECTFTVNGELLPHTFFASEGVWVGARFALFAKNRKGNSEGYAVFTSFNR